MNEQLTSDELRQVLAEWIRPMYPKQRQKIAGLFEAVIARAEAADARAEQFRRDYNDLYDDYHEMRHRLADIGAMLRAARQRVAELESQLAAQGWRPVTEKPIEDEYYLTYDALLPGNEPWIVNYYSRTQGWANCCSAWLCPPPKPPRPTGDGVTPSK